MEPAVPAAAALAATGAAAPTGADVEGCKALWCAVLQGAFEDLRDAHGGRLGDALAWIKGGGTFEIAVLALESDSDFIYRAARRLLERRFGRLEAARLLDEPLVLPRWRRARRVA